MPDFIQPSFASGVLDPELHGRVDIAKYHAGLAEGRNMFVHPYGGVSNRAGFEFVATAAAKSHAAAAGSMPVRLIPFRFSGDDAYVLEFGDEYMRVIRNGAYVIDLAVTGITSSVNTDGDTVFNKAGFGGHGYQNDDEVYLSGFTEATELNGMWAVVAEVAGRDFQLKDQITGEAISVATQETTGGSASKIYEISTPYGATDVPYLKFVQANDVVTLVNRNFAAMELKRYNHDSWAIGPVNYSASMMGPIDTEKLPAPTGVTLTSSTGSLTVAFDRVALADYYEIFVSTSNLINGTGTPEAQVLQGTTATMSQTISGLTSGTTYYMRMRAVQEGVGTGVFVSDVLGRLTASMNIMVP